MIDYGALHEKHWAQLIPAVSPAYNTAWLNALNSPRPLRNNITQDDLNFLKRSNPLFFLDKVLYSAGLAAGKKDYDLVKDKAGHDAELTGDSGGYQAATGTLKWAMREWLENLLPFAEEYCDFCPIADLPTSAIANNPDDADNEEDDEDGEEAKPARKPFKHHVDRLMMNNGFDPTIVENPSDTLHTLIAKNKHSPEFNTCLWYTKYNTEWILANKNPDVNTKWLNVIQGIGLDESEAWLNEMINYPLDGMCFPASHLTRMEQTLNAISRLWDDGMLGKYKRLHFLGTGQAQNFVVYSEVLKQIQKHVNPDISCTGDVSSAVYETKQGNMAVGFTIGNGEWAVQRIHASKPAALKEGQKKEPSELANMPPNTNLEEALLHLWKKRYFGGTRVAKGWIETDSLVYRNDDPRFFVRTEIAKLLTVSDIFDLSRGKHGTDNLAYLYMYNHNLQVYAQSVYTALQYSDAAHPMFTSPTLEKVKMAIRNVFESPPEDRLDYIFVNRKELNIPDWINGKSR